MQGGTRPYLDITDMTAASTSMTRETTKYPADPLILSLAHFSEMRKSLASKDFLNKCCHVQQCERNHVAKPRLGGAGR